MLPRSLPEGAIPHGSKLKIRMRHPGGWWVDRIPGWIHWATGGRFFLCLLLSLLPGLLPAFSWQAKGCVLPRSSALCCHDVMPPCLPLHVNQHACWPINPLAVPVGKMGAKYDGIHW